MTPRHELEPVDAAAVWKTLSAEQQERIGTTAIRVALAFAAQDAAEAYGAPLIDLERLAEALLADMFQAVADVFPDVPSETVPK